MLALGRVSSEPPVNKAINTRLLLDYKLPEKRELFFLNILSLTSQSVMQSDCINLLNNLAVQ